MIAPLINVEPFEPDHLDELVVQPLQEPAVPVGFGDFAWWHGPAWTVRVAAGRVIFCGGFLVQHEARAIGWALMAVDKGAAFLALTRRVLLALDAAPWRRIEIYNDPGFDAGARWARRLGFAKEDAVRLGDGDVHMLWSRTGRH